MVRADRRRGRVAYQVALVFVLSLVAWVVRVPLGASAASAQVACPCSIFSVLDTPAIPAVADSQPIELGVRFRAEQDGNVLGVRFFKGGPANGGSHVGRLRGPDGTVLAVATFVGETATGWQEVLFSEPVQVSAGVTYIASYHAPQGNYAVTYDYFVTARTEHSAHRSGERPGRRQRRVPSRRRFARAVGDGPQRELLGRRRLRGDGTARRHRHRRTHGHRTVAGGLGDQRPEIRRPSRRRSRSRSSTVRRKSSRRRRAVPSPAA